MMARRKKQKKLKCINIAHPDTDPKSYDKFLQTSKPLYIAGATHADVIVSLQLATRAQAQSMGMHRVNLTKGYNEFTYHGHYRIRVLMPKDWDGL